MQLLAHWSFPDRAVYYAARLHAQQLQEGEDFTQLRHTFSICILDAIQFPNLPGFHSCFRLHEEKHPEVVFSPQLEFHLLELPKFQVGAADLTTPLEQWVYFLRHAAQLDTDRLPPTLQVPEIGKAFEELIMVTQSERDRARYEDRFKAELDARSFQKVHEETGLRKGLEQGREELRQVVAGHKAFLVEQIHHFQQTLRQTQTSPTELSALPEAELQHLLGLLIQQVTGGARPPNGST
jgi:predicted transposase/invertase (TIGR01784 family)